MGTQEEFESRDRNMMAQCRGMLLLMHISASKLISRRVCRNRNEEPPGVQFIPRISRNMTTLRQIYSNPHLKLNVRFNNFEAAHVWIALLELQ